MSNRFDAIAGRRAVLLEEIAQARQEMTLVALGLRKELALAGIGFMLSKLIGRKRWSQLAGLAALAVALGRPLLAHFFGSRR